jgi:hypothetical protein
VFNGEASQVGSQLSMCQHQQVAGVAFHSIGQGAWSGGQVRPGLLFSPARLLHSAVPAVAGGGV